MLFLLAIAGLAGFFFYDPLFYTAGIASLLLWVIQYAMRSRQFYASLEKGPSPSTMMISSIVTMTIIAGILYIFFNWNGVAWMGIVFGILIPKSKRNQENKNSAIQS